MQPTSIFRGSPVAMTSMAPSRSSGIPIVRAKLFAVPSGRKAKTTFVPMKKSTTEDKRPVAAADDDHRRLLERGLDRRFHALGGLALLGVDKLDACGLQLVAGFGEELGAPTAARIDDQDGLFRQRFIHPVGQCSTGPFFPVYLRRDGSLSRPSHAPRPVERRGCATCSPSIACIRATSSCRCSSAKARAARSRSSPCAA